MNFITWLFAGAVLGWLASLVFVQRRRSAKLLNIVAGMVGAFVAGYLLSPVFHVSATDQTFLSPQALIVALGGAVFLLVVVHFFHKEAHVNSEVIDRKWARVRGKIHTRWDRLTEEDLSTIDGNHSLFTATLQKRYGCSLEQAEDQKQRYIQSALADSGLSFEYDQAQVAERLSILDANKP